jgi:asparagine synthase (glutamine-hydrolysing)
VLLPTVEERPPLHGEESAWENLDDAHAMMLLDLRTYLTDDILVKVDRASMAVSLELRAPLLDHRVIEFAWRLPLRQKILGSTGKRLLRRVLSRHVPTQLIDRPKRGFGLPLDDWLRGPLRGWVHDLLSPAALSRHGLLEAAPVQAALEDHLSKRSNRTHQLWAVLMLQAWLNVNRGNQ